MFCIGLRTPVSVVLSFSLACSAELMLKCAGLRSPDRVLGRGWLMLACLTYVVPSTLIRVPPWPLAL
eukprot:951098-Amphidinium_carterae.1